MLALTMEFNPSVRIFSVSNRAKINLHLENATASVRAGRDLKMVEYSESEEH